MCVNTYLLIQWSTVHLEKLTSFQLFNKFPSFYGTRMVHYRIHKRPPPFHILCILFTFLMSYQSISPGPRLMWTIRNRILFYLEELLAPRPTPKLEDHPLWAVRDSLCNIFAVILHIGGRSSIRNLRTRHAVVVGTHLPWRCAWKLSLYTAIRIQYNIIYIHTVYIKFPLFITFLRIYSELG